MLARTGRSAPQLEGRSAQPDRLADETHISEFRVLKRHRDPAMLDLRVGEGLSHVVDRAGTADRLR